MWNPNAFNDEKLKEAEDKEREKQRPGGKGPKL
jgi:hypothetical protein